MSNIVHGDSLDVMATMPAESIDAVVTDPPYGIGFMGRGWDRGVIGVPFWEQALRVAKPSAYLLAFGGTRTVHRLASAIEDAGWIIRDMLVWGYASGFPKSKASLKPAWEPIVMARKPGPLRELAIDACRIGTTRDVSASHSRTAPTIGATGFADRRVESELDPNLGRWPANIILTDPIFDGGWEGVVGGGETSSGLGTRRSPFDSYSGGFGATDEVTATYGDSGTYSRFFQIPRGASCDWCGASTADPSSSQPSPLDGSAPSDAAISTDGQQVSIERLMDSPNTSAIETSSLSDDAANTPHTRRSRQRGTSHASTRPSSPAKSPDVASPETDTTTTIPGLSMCATCVEATTSVTTSPSPSYTRFLIIPKADRADREPVLGGLPVGFAPTMNDGIGGREHSPNDPRSYRQNVHPTVKPTDLMRHLVRLVTPTGGTVLDPFLGSGTTGLAAEMEGFDWIGIEKEAEYVAIAEARLNGTQRGLGLEAS